jgi:hypothetical protein
MEIYIYIYIYLYGIFQLVLTRAEDYIRGIRDWLNDLFN